MDDKIVVTRGRHASSRRHVVAIVGAFVLGAAAVVATRGFHSQTAWSSVGAEFAARINSGPAGFADVVDAVKPAVIGVQSKLAADPDNQDTRPTDRFFRKFGPLPREPEALGKVVTAQGSGFFISPDGYAVTNNHVVEGSTTVSVQTDDRKSYTAKVVGADPISDLALLKVGGRDDFPHVRLADKPPRIGDWVLAIGNPFGLGGTVTAGIVSARERNIGGGSAENFIQIDAPVNQGDSGGPSFDLDGRVIGVNTMIFSPSGGSIGIAFAIPAETVKALIPQLKDKGAVTRGWLGVQIQPVTAEIADALGLKEPQGALVTEPQADGPAAKAGIASGDVVRSVGGVAVKDPTELSKAISSSAPRTSVKLGVLRQGEEKTIAVTLGEYPVKRQAAAPAEQPGTTGRGDGSSKEASKETSKSDALGLKLAPADTVPGAGKQGVVVTGLDPTGAAADSGVEPGDVIVEVGGKAVRTPGEIRNALNAARGDGQRSVLMRVKSGETTRFVAVPTG